MALAWVWAVTAEAAGAVLVGVLAADELHTLERILTKVLLGAGDAVVAQRLGDK